MPEVTLEEMEAQLETAAEAAKPTAATIKLDASDLPDYAGKTAADIAADNARLKEALRLSEESRLSMRTALETPRPVTPAAPVVPAGPPAKTREELAELMQTDPLAVVDYMSTHMAHQLGTHFDRRFQPIVEGNISTMEARFREKYKDEFDLFGSQIAEVKTKVRPEVLSTEEGWNDIVSYVRGLPTNFDKLMEHKMKGRTAVAPVVARTAQVEATGFTPREVARTPIGAPAGGDHGLDETQLEICRVMGLDPSEYKKWM